MITYRSNNKKLGTAFEQEAVSLLAKLGYWAHFISPDRRGAQPFDIIAAKNGIAFAIDCKTSVPKWFNISRLEDNQIMAFELWLKCGNNNPIILVKYRDFIYCIDYIILKHETSINLAEWKPTDGMDELQKELNDEYKKVLDNSSNNSVNSNNKISRQDISKKRKC